MTRLLRLPLILAFLGGLAGWPAIAANSAAPVDQTTPATADPPPDAATAPPADTVPDGPVAPDADQSGQPPDDAAPPPDDPTAPPADAAPDSSVAPDTGQSDQPPDNAAPPPDDQSLPPADAAEPAPPDNAAPPVGGAVALPPAAAPGEPAPTPEAASLNPLSTLTLDGFKATLDRPLFARTRRGPAPEVVDTPPPEPVAAPPQEPAPEDLNLRLVGLILSDPDNLALLLDESTGEIHRVRVGDDYDGWKVVVLDPRTVELRRDAERHTLTMFVAPPDEPAAPPDATPPDQPAPEDQPPNADQPPPDQPPLPKPKKAGAPGKPLMPIKAPPPGHVRADKKPEFLMLGKQRAILTP